ncbi:MAG: hypothetical protein ABJC09_15430 [Terriglobia bacterium]
MFAKAEDPAAEVHAERERTAAMQREQELEYRRRENWQGESSGSTEMSRSGVALKISGRT